MGLSSAMTTALTGLHAAETQIDVSGNNLANSQTVGFKASDVIFANQFLRTLGQGSPPSEDTGGTNPRQIGLGVQVAGITPDFSQGTIEISASPSDLAIQGDGFFIVEGPQGEPLYTRNGIFTTNSENELVSATGNRLLGYGVDEFYQLQETTLVPLEIPLGSAAAAQATQNVFLNGNLTPTGDVASTAEVIDSGILGDGQYVRPDGSGVVATAISNADPALLDDTALNGIYNYVITYSGSGGIPETRPSELISPSAPVVNGLIHLDISGATPPAEYDTINIYRSLATNPDQYYLVTSLQPGVGETEYTDHQSDAEIVANPALDMDGPKINNATRLVNILRRDGLEYENLFEAGELTYTGRKGGNLLTTKTFEITDTTTVADYLRFLEEASGIQKPVAGDTVHHSRLDQHHFW